MSSGVDVKPYVVLKFDNFSRLPASGSGFTNNIVALEQPHFSDPLSYKKIYGKSNQRLSFFWSNRFKSLSCLINLNVTHTYT